MARVKHGHARSHTCGGKTKTYGIWCAMKRRCYNKEAAFYEDYGGRGIQVCARWHDYAAFLEDMGEAPDGLTLDRKDNDGDYEPDNCHWVSRSQQASNRRSNVRIEFDGKNMTLTEWGQETGIGFDVLRRRLVLKWPVEKMLTTPVSPVAKLDETKVDEIRKMLKDNVSPKDIAEKFSVSRGTVYGIRAGRVWPR